MPSAKTSLADFCSPSEALGEISDDMKLALDVSEEVVGQLGDREFQFHLLCEPCEGDWLYEQREVGQTFSEYLEQTQDILVPFPDMPPISKVAFNKILLCPIGDSSTKMLHDLFFPHLIEYCSAFFPGMPVDLLDETLSLQGVRSRSNEFGHSQYSIRDLLNMLKTHKQITSKNHIYVRLGVTFEDIYPDDPTFKFVSGQGQYTERVGIFSFARRSPLFSDGVVASEASAILNRLQLFEWLGHLRNTMTHELCHMLGMEHCVFLHCLMNGLSGLQDSNCGMNFLCPICLRKLMHILTAACGVATLETVRTRYLNMSNALKSLVQDATQKSDTCLEATSDIPAIHADIVWLSRRLAFLETDNDARVSPSDSDEEAGWEERYAFVEDRGGLADDDLFSGEISLTPQQQSELDELGWWRPAAEHRKETKQDVGSRNLLNSSLSGDTRRTRGEEHETKVENAKADDHRKERQSKKQAAKSSSKSALKSMKGKGKGESRSTKE